MTHDPLHADHSFAHLSRTEVPVTEASLLRWSLLALLLVIATIAIGGPA